MEKGLELLLTQIMRTQSETDSKIASLEKKFDAEMSDLKEQINSLIQVNASRNAVSRVLNASVHVIVGFIIQISIAVFGAKHGG